MRAIVLGVATLAACNYPALPRLGGGGGGDGGTGGDGVNPGPPMLAAVEPAVAKAGDTITLEGTFVAPATVNFPGGVTAPATVLGGHRATAIVPPGSGTGALSVTTGGVDTLQVAFRTTSFAPKLSNFRLRFEQTDAARPAPVLTAARESPTTAIAGGYLYVIGGYNGANFLASIERAMVNADGTLGPFAVVTGVTLATARSSATSVVIGNAIYVIGGIGNGAAINSVERATIGTDGSLGSFALVTGVTLATARSDASSVVIGNALYVIGGNGAAGKLSSLERATIDPDGTLEAFAPAPGVGLSTSRAGASSIAVGGFLYVLGGASPSGIKSSVESAAIAPDGTLGAFAATTGVSLAAARADFTTALLGGSLYVIGGNNDTGDLSTIESSSSAPDGTLAGFSLTSGLAVSTARHDAASAFTGDFIYLIGGDAGSTQLTSVERANIGNDGALAAFATEPSVTLSASRVTATSVVIGKYVYLIGGVDLTVPVALTNVDRATIQPDGSLGAFSLVPSVALTTARGGAMTAVIGNFLYVIGGQATGTNEGSATIERAAINADGTIGTFQAYPQSQLVVGRQFATCAIVNSTLYVFGGVGGGFPSLGSIEQAPIQSNGTLGAFAASTIQMGFSHVAPTSAVLGNYVYVLGGDDGEGAAGVFERAPIGASGLGAFDYELDGQGNQMYLATAREFHSNVVIGDFLYEIGGLNANGSPPPSDPGLTSVEQSTIASTGSLGAFATLPSAALPVGIFDHRSAQLGNFAYILGGGSHTSGTIGQSVEQALQP